MAEPKIRKPKKAELDDGVFGVEFNGPLVHECVRAERNARRRGTAATKTRGKVRGGGVKPWRQKGTGRARAGSIRSPLWTGGGTIFGPSPRHYTFKVNRKARKAALRSALSLHAGRDSLGLLDGASFDEPKAKLAAGALTGWGQPLPALVVVAPDEALAAKSFRNLSGVEVRSADDVGIADIVRVASLVITDGAVEQLVTLAAKAAKDDAAKDEPVKEEAA